MKEKRIYQIANYIESVGVVSMEELCKYFDISMSTLRRDINILLERNSVQKVYGGVSANEHGLIPFENRDIINKSEKSTIAKNAAQLICSNELIFIDSGTTTQDIVKYLPSHISKLTILTNNLDIINDVAGRTDINLLVLGNIFKHSTRSFVGNDTVDIINKYNINKAFMAATAVSIENGLTNSDIQEYEIKKRVVEKSHQVYLLTDASKFDHATLLTYAQLQDITGIVTSKSIPEKYCTYCRENGIKLVLSK